MCIITIKVFCLLEVLCIFLLLPVLQIIQVVDEFLLFEITSLRQDYNVELGIKLVNTSYYTRLKLSSIFRALCVTKMQHSLTKQVPTVFVNRHCTQFSVGF